MELEAEFTTEPFHGEGEPPEHARQALRRAEEAGLRTDFGPLGTTIRGDGEDVLTALEPILRAALDAGATGVTLRVQRAGTRRAELGITDALGRLIADIEAELGGRLAGLPRADKQRAVRLLDERGAFTLRRSVATVAQALGVTRFTVYNYLNRTD